MPGQRKSESVAADLQIWGEKIRARREALHLSQLELAEMVGVHQVTVSRWELGQCAPSRRRRLLVAAALQVTTDGLFPIAALQAAS